VEFVRFRDIWEGREVSLRREERGEGEEEEEEACAGAVGVANNPGTAVGEAETLKDERCDDAGIDAEVELLLLLLLLSPTSSPISSSFVIYSSGYGVRRRPRVERCGR
jgi:hypothetical protein